MADTAIKDKHGAMPPYVAYRTFKTHVADLREHGVPSRIDSDVLKKLPGSTARQLKGGLRFLGLTDAEDHPTDELHKLAGAYGTDQWKGTLSMMLRTRYGEFLTTIDLPRATASQFREKFRTVYKPGDEMARRCEAFFLQAAQEAEFDISKRIPIITRQRAPGNGRKRIAKAEGETKERKERANNNPPPPPPSDAIALAKLNLDPLIMVLLSRIPPKADGWPKEQRLRWFKTFAVNVSEVYDEPTMPIDLKIELAVAAESSGHGE